MKALYIIGFLAISLLTQAQDANEIRQLVEAQDFTFRAETAHPQAGSSRMLSGGYDLQVSPSTIVSYLPYFGRAHAPTYPSEGGIKFSSSDFSYEKKADGKGWDILVKPRDVKENYILRLTIFENGRATLNVNSNNRQSISFNGQIVKRANNGGAK